MRVYFEERGESRRKFFKMRNAEFGMRNKKKPALKEILGKAGF